MVGPGLAGVTVVTLALVPAVLFVGGLVVGVAVGRRVSPRIPEQYRTAGTLLLLSVIAVRLAATGVQAL